MQCLGMVNDVAVTATRGASGAVDAVKDSVASAVGGVAKSAPPAAVAGMTWFGYPVADWVQVGALAWIAVRFTGWMWDRFVSRRHKGKQA